MENRKRSRHIDLGGMRKAFAPKPLTIAIASILLASCGQRHQASVYTDLDDCIRDNPRYAEQCKSAHRTALREANRTGPKYRTKRECEREFGPNQCHSVELDNKTLFTPIMAGFMLRQPMQRNERDSQPIYTSYSRHSHLWGRWGGADGKKLGDSRNVNLRVGKEAFAPKPSVKQTSQRGGFGAQARARSSGGSRGWGG